MQQNNELINMMKAVAEEREIQFDVVVSSFEDAMKKAYMKEFPEETIEVIIDKDTGKITLNKLFLIVGNNKEELNEYCEIELSNAKKINPNYTLGDYHKQSIDIWSLERRVVVHMLQVFKHSISNESNKEVYKEWAPKIGTVVNAEVEKADYRSGTALINLDKTYGFMPKKESNSEERLIPGSKYKFYIKEVLEQSKGWPIILSRADAQLVKYLLTTNIPEIQEDIVEIVKIARVSGFKTKVSVRSKQPGIDPVGACIGARADRIRPILNEIGSEKIEFVEWTEDVAKYLINACNPAPLLGYKIIEPENETDRKRIVLIVDEHKLALIIGSKGKNVKLLSELLEANVDIKTIEEARTEGINYERIQYTKNLQTNFSKTYDKYKTGNYEVLESIGNIDYSTPLHENAKNNKVEKRNETIVVEKPHEVKKDLPPIDSSSLNMEGLEDSIAEMEELIKNVQEK